MTASLYPYIGFVYYRTERAEAQGAARRTPDTQAALLVFLLHCFPHLVIMEPFKLNTCRKTISCQTHSLDESFGKAISFREPVVGANR